MIIDNKQILHHLRNTFINLGDIDSNDDFLKIKRGNKRVFVTLNPESKSFDSFVEKFGKQELNALRLVTIIFEEVSKEVNSGGKLLEKLVLKRVVLKNEVWKMIEKRKFLSKK